MRVPSIIGAVALFFGIALTLLVMLGRFTVFGFLPRTLYVEMINTYITKGDTEKTLLDEKC